MKLLVPVDFSDNAKTALKYAFQLSELEQFNVTVCHIFNPSLSLFSADELKMKLHEFSESIIEALNIKDVRFNCKCIEGESILSLTDADISSTVDLIIMGTKGGSDVNSNLVGSNTVNLLNKTNKPVLVIPNSTEFRMARNIMFCSDYKNLEIDYSLPILKKIAVLMKSDIRIVHIKTNDNLPVPEHIEESRREGHFFEPEIEPSYKLVHAKSVFSGINYFMELKGDNDILAIVNRHHGFFKRLFSDNTTEKMAYHSDVPLLVIPE